jgi:hypothetical protein
MGFAALNPSYGLCHLITDPLYSKASTRLVSKTEVEDEREKLTDHLAVMAHKLMSNANDMAAKESAMQAAATLS